MLLRNMENIFIFIHKYFFAYIKYIFYIYIFYIYTYMSHIRPILVKISVAALFVHNICWLRHIKAQRDAG